MIDLSDFLLARIAEREAAALAATPGPWKWDISEPYEGPYGRGVRQYPSQVIGLEGADHRHVLEPLASDPWELEIKCTEADRVHIALNDPARVLAECKAQRQVIGLLDGYTDRDVEYWALHEALELLALPYADHPDYRSEWRP